MHAFACHWKADKNLGATLSPLQIKSDQFGGSSLCRGGQRGPEEARKKMPLEGKDRVPDLFYDLVHETQAYLTFTNSSSTSFPFVKILF